MYNHDPVRTVNPLRDRFLLRDPGLVRATFASRTLLTLLVAGLACHAVATLAGFGASGTVLGVVAAQLTVILARQPARAARVLTCLAILPGCWAGVLLLYRLQAYPWLDIALVPVLIGAGFLAQALHARLGAAVLAAAWVSLFTLYLHAAGAPPVAHLVGVTVGPLCAMLVRFVVWRDDRTLGLRLLVRTHRLVLADFAARTAHGGMSSSLTRLQTRMQPVAGALLANPAVGTALRDALFDLRLAVEVAVLRDERSAAALGDALRAALDPQAMETSATRAAIRAAVRVDALLQDACVSERIVNGAVTPERTGAPDGERASNRRLGIDRAGQVFVAASVATVGGYLVSPQYWPWAVIVSMMLYLGTESSAHVLDKGLASATGVLIGVVAGVAATGLLGTIPQAEIALAVAALGMAFYLMPVSYAAGSASITLALGLVYQLLGRPTVPVLEVRLAEVLIGAFAGGLASLVIRPHRPRALLRLRAATFLDAVADALDPEAAPVPRAELRRRFAALVAAANLGRLGGLLIARGRVRAALADLSRLLHLVEMYRNLAVTAGSGEQGAHGDAMRHRRRLAAGRTRSLAAAITGEVAAPVPADEGGGPACDDALDEQAMRSIEDTVARLAHRTGH